MRYKVNSTAEKQSLQKYLMGKYDWTLWYGESFNSCYQVQGLFRCTPTDKKHSNCIGKDGYLKSEQLTFQSKKAAYRYIIKNKEWFKEDYSKRNNGRTCNYIIAMTWRGNQKPLIVNI